jgi:hypothetical protein
MTQFADRVRKAIRSEAISSKQLGLFLPDSSIRLIIEGLEEEKWGIFSCLFVDFMLITFRE